MRLPVTLMTIGLASAALAACSEKTQQQVQEVGNSTADDVRNAINDANAASQNVARDTQASMDRLNNRAEAVLNQADARLDNASNAAGTALEKAGRSLKK